MIINTYAMTLNVLMIQLLSFNAHYVTKDEHLNILFYPFCSTIWILTIFSTFYATYTKKKKLHWIYHSSPNHFSQNKLSLMDNGEIKKENTVNRHQNQQEYSQRFTITLGY